MRECPNCKWQFPTTNHSTKCKFCNAVHTTQYCTDCDKFLPTANFYFNKAGRRRSKCTKCHTAQNTALGKKDLSRGYYRQVKFQDKRTALAEDKYDMILNSGLEFKPLSENEWLEACSYFGGCAICGGEHIETREFFVHFKDGGRYAPWNVFPMCGKCGIRKRQVSNPFLWLDKYRGFARDYGLTEERRERLEKYITRQIEKASEQSG